MKTSINLLIASSLTLAALPALADGHGDPYTPVGSLDVSATTVASGTQPSLSWDITYPVTVPEIVTITPTGKIITTEELRMQIRVAGVAFGTSSTELPVAFWTQINGGSWNQLFYGTGSDVQADEYLFDAVVPANTEVNLAGRARSSSGGWYGIRWTSQPDVAVTACINGDETPDYAPAYSQGDIESFLTSYVNSDTDTFQLGPRDIIYLFELASRNTGDYWFDMQDLVVVITFEQTTTTTSAP